MQQWQFNCDLNGWCRKRTCFLLLGLVPASAHLWVIFVKSSQFPHTVQSLLQSLVTND